ncbi:MAG: hypothetical protein EP340_02930 [Alphaproteobacteria bacterium]|nr:MAG: hypothetical protein EP340_02930 [Alphaproteobacteria bacterium]
MTQNARLSRLLGIIFAVIAILVICVLAFDLIDAVWLQRENYARVMQPQWGWARSSLSHYVFTSLLEIAVLGVVAWLPCWQDSFRSVAGRISLLAVFFLFTRMTHLVGN